MRQFATAVLAIVACGTQPVPGVDTFGDEGTTTLAAAESSSEGSAADPPDWSTSTTDGPDGEPKLDVAPEDPEDPFEIECDDLDDGPATSVGCVFFAVDVPVGSSYNLPLGVIVGNPGSSTVHVAIDDLRGPGGSVRELTTVKLKPKRSKLVKINGDGGILHGEDHALEGDGVHEAGAFRVTADKPITAAQINPVGGGPTAVAEASSLLPVNALGYAHIALGYEPVIGAGFLLVVATQDGTTVTSGITQHRIDAFDVAAFTIAGDPTGLRVDADKPVAVFSGTPCSFVPTGISFCDHLEEQLVPLEAWGREYVGARHPPRLPDMNPWEEQVAWRIIGAVDQMTVEIEPPVTGMNGQVQLGHAGTFHEFQTAENFRVKSDDPFIVVQYMIGCASVVHSGPCIELNQASGDPYMLQMTPREQWLTGVPFFTDRSYPRDFVVVTREAGTPVTLDCLGIIPDDHFSPVIGTDLEVGFVDLDFDDDGGEGNCKDGQQYLSAKEPIGAYVGGLDYASSYAYPAGMNLKAVWTPPPPG